MGRPFKEIDWNIVDKLIEYGCTGLEIAAKFRIQPDTFYRRFKKQYNCAFQDYKAETQEASCADIRAMLHSKALNNKAPGNTHLLIFLAKARLGMREVEDSSVSKNQTYIDQTHAIMKLSYENERLKNQLRIYES